METSLPVADRPRRPEWMKVRAPSRDSEYFDVQKLIHGLSLHTICEEARCPNIGECWGRGTATFQIMGDVCTRACRTLEGEHRMVPGAPEPLEPHVGQLGLFADSPAPDPMVEELRRQIDVNALTPLEALNRLAEFKRQAEGRR